MDHHASHRPGPAVLARYVAGRAAAASIESVLSIAGLVAMFAAIIGIVSAFQLQNHVERAAWAVARSNSLALGPAATADELIARVREVVEAEAGTSLDPGRLEVVVTAYGTPADIQGGTPSDLPSASLGGDPDDMVVVRVRYSPSRLNPVQRLLGGSVIQSVAVARNEAEADG